MLGRTTLSLLLVLTATAAWAEDWPQFRGPTGQGYSSEHSLPVEWSETRNIIWKMPVPGEGWSSPVVADGRVWLTTSIQTGNAASLRALAFDVPSGRKIVDVEVFRLPHAPGDINPKNSRASPTPIVEGDRVYVHYGMDGTAALTTSGTIVWKTQLEYRSQHGNGGSPVLFGDLLIVNCDGDDTAFVVALEKQTGKIRWKTMRRRPFAQAYSTPLVIRVADRDELLSVGAYRTAAYEPQTGREIWRVSYPVRFPEGFSNVMRPVYGDGLVFISGGFNEPSFLAVRPDGEGDVTKTHIAWTIQRGAPFTPSPLLVGDDLYVVTDTGILYCFDARSGVPHYQQRLGSTYSASPVLAEGRIYFLSEDGVTTVIKTGPVFERVATDEINGATLASMAVSGGSIYIRSNTDLYRIGSKQP
jgi:outer membrane protein assembly factor BamB